MIKSLVSTALMCCLMIGAEPVYHARFNTVHAAGGLEGGVR